MIKIISHNDLDGYGCSILAQKVFGKENVECVHLTNLPEEKMIEFFKENMKDWDKYDIIFVTDLSLPKVVLKSFTTFNKNRIKNSDNPDQYGIYYIDHHKSSAINLKHYIKKYPEFVKVNHLDRSETPNPQCGTSLFYDTLDRLLRAGRFDGANVLLHLPSASYNNKPSLCGSIDRYLQMVCTLNTPVYINNFVQAVRLWDTFNWVEYMDSNNEVSVKMAQDAVRLNRIFKSVPHQYFVNTILSRNNMDGSSIFNAQIEAYVDYEHQAQLRDMTRRVEDEGITRYLTGTEEVCKFTDDKMDDEYIAKYLNDKKVKGFSYETLILINCNDVSLARDVAMEVKHYDLLFVWNPITKLLNIRVADGCDFDASKFATERGGGGHKKAAGIFYKDTNNDAMLALDIQLREILSYVISYRKDNI